MGDAGGDVVVAAARVLHERVTGGENPRRAVPLQAPHRPEPGLQPPVICFGSVIRVLLNGVQGRGDQLAGHPRAGRRAAGRNLGRDRACAHRPGEEPLGGRQIPPSRQQDAGNLAVLVGRPGTDRPTDRPP